MERQRHGALGVEAELHHLPRQVVGDNHDVLVVALQLAQEVHQLAVRVHALVLVVGALVVARQVAEQAEELRGLLQEAHRVGVVQQRVRREFGAEVVPEEDQQRVVDDCRRRRRRGGVRRPPAASEDPAAPLPAAAASASRAISRSTMPSMASTASRPTRLESFVA